MVLSFMRADEPPAALIKVSLKVNGTVIAAQGVLEDGETLVGVRDMQPSLPFNYTVGSVNVEARLVEIKLDGGSSAFLDLVILNQKGHVGLRDLVEALLPAGKTASYGFAPGTGGKPATVEVSIT